jgi:hypothetical protein
VGGGGLRGGAGVGGGLGGVGGTTVVVVVVVVAAVVGGVVGGGVCGGVVARGGVVAVWMPRAAAVGGDVRAEVAWVAATVVVVAGIVGGEAVVTTGIDDGLEVNPT